MTRVAWLLFALVPLLALWLAAPPERAAYGLAAAPFGWPSLLVVHLLAAVPAGWLLARRLKPVENPGPVVLLGLLAAGGGYLLVGELGGALDEAGFGVRSVARSLFVLLLVVPWCLAANGTRATTDPVLAVVAVVVLFALPAVHADRLADRAVAEAEGLFYRDRMAQAAPHLTAAADLDPARAFSDRETVAQKRTKLRTLLADLAKQADLPPTKPSLTHALALLALDRLADAEAYLLPLAERDPLARLYLGECRQRRGNWAAGDLDISAALAELDPRTAPNAYQKGFDLLAESATEHGSAAEREAVLRAALAKMPAQAGYWHLQLGRHFKLSGRPFDALAEFARAEAADPKLLPQLTALRRDLREHTPGCLVR